MGRPFLSKLVEFVCNQEQDFKNYFRESQCLDFPRRAGCLGEFVTNLPESAAVFSLPRRSILSAAERESLVEAGDVPCEIDQAPIPARLITDQQIQTARQMP